MVVFHDKVKQMVACENLSTIQNILLLMWLFYELNISGIPINNPSFNFNPYKKFIRITILIKNFVYNLGPYRQLPLMEANVACHVGRHAT